MGCVLHAHRTPRPTQKRAHAQFSAWTQAAPSPSGASQARPWVPSPTPSPSGAAPDDADEEASLVLYNTPRGDLRAAALDMDERHRHTPRGWTSRAALGKLKAGLPAACETLKAKLPLSLQKRVKLPASCRTAALLDPTHHTGGGGEPEYDGEELGRVHTALHSLNDPRKSCTLVLYGVLQLQHCFTASLSLPL